MIDSEQLEYAKSLLKSEGVKEIFRAIEVRYFEEWKNCQTEDHQKQQKCHAMIKALEDLKIEIESIAKSEEVGMFNSRLATKSKLR